MTRSAAPTPVRVLVADGIHLVGDAWGAPDAQPVVLLTGAGQTRQAWGRTGEALARGGYRAVAVDHRGHGDSSWPSGEGAYGMDVIVDDIAALCRSFHRPVVVGASLGGLSALIGIADRGTIDARALVMVDVAPRLEVDGAERILKFMAGHPDGFGSLDEAAEWIAAYLPSRGRPATTAGLEKVLRPHGGRWRWHWDPRFLEGLLSAIDQAGGAEARFEAMRRRLLVAASKLRIPTLLVRGAMSDVVSEAGAREFLAAVPNAKYADVSGAGHMVAGDQNDAFTAAILAFLADLPPERESERR